MDISLLFYSFCFGVVVIDVDDDVLAHIGIGQL
jgi:hypothetical protein